MPKILISACLLGEKVRYDGNDCLQTNQRLQALIMAKKVIAICPEMAGGLPAPRDPAEIQTSKTALNVLEGSAKVITYKGHDVTAQYLKGALAALALAKKHQIRIAILKANSPSCGSKKIYDGTFSGKLIPGMGVTAAILSQHGIEVFDENQIDEALWRDHL
jgi:uncharacterized protein YbbK (DUF523 family)